MLGLKNSSSAVSSAEAYIFLSFMMSPKEKNQRDLGLVTELAGILAPAFLSITQCRQSQDNFCWQDLSGLGQYYA
jgi:hypothetical protein